MAPCLMVAPGRPFHAEAPTKFVPDVRLDLVDAPSNEDKPVVAVLPFANLSDDPNLAYFADGLADDLIFSLSAFRWFRVLAQAATFRVRDAKANHADVRQMFGATHVVNGRVRRAGSRLRLTIELADCRSGQQLWAGRYDKALDDLFEVQDDVTRRVVAGIEPALEDREMRRALGRPPETLAAYELLLRGYRQSLACGNVATGHLAKVAEGQSIDLPTASARAVYPQ
jgi:adenylate cyclase